MHVEQHSDRPVRIRMRTKGSSMEDNAEFCHQNISGERNPIALASYIHGLSNVDTSGISQGVQALPTRLQMDPSPRPISHHKRSKENRATHENNPENVNVLKCEVFAASYPSEARNSVLKGEASSLVALSTSKSDPQLPVSSIFSTTDRANHSPLIPLNFSAAASNGKGEDSRVGEDRVASPPPFAPTETEGVQQSSPTLSDRIYPSTRFNPCVGESAKTSGPLGDNTSSQPDLRLESLVEYCDHESYSLKSPLHANVERGEESPSGRSVQSPGQALSAKRQAEWNRGVKQNANGNAVLETQSTPRTGRRLELTSIYSERSLPQSEKGADSAVGRPAHLHVSHGEHEHCTGADEIYSDSVLHAESSDSESSSDSDIKSTVIEQPCLAFCVDRSNPDGWRLRPPRKHAFERPLHQFQLIACMLAIIGAVLFYTDVTMGYVLLYRRGHRSCLVELVTFATAETLFLVMYWITWLCISLRENGDVEGVGEFCIYCFRNTNVESKHCKACNKCISGFDHHCKWLNMCIGDKNYRLFLAHVICAILMMGTSLAGNLVLIARWWKEVTEIHLYFAVATILLCALILIGLVPTIHLLGFHVMLNLKDMVTYEYIQYKRAKRLNPHN